MVLKAFGPLQIPSFPSLSHCIAINHNHSCHIIILILLFLNLQLALPVLSAFLYHLGYYDQHDPNPTRLIIFFYEDRRSA
ncbi:hypothetical protein Lal_00019241 [Lupinus albus]|nr:hypothetical protein Lal_00019241 [Lupinus albus]